MYGRTLPAYARTLVRRKRSPTCLPRPDFHEEPAGHGRRHPPLACGALSLHARHRGEHGVLGGQDPGRKGRAGGVHGIDGAGPVRALDRLDGGRAGLRRAGAGSRRAPGDRPRGGTPRGRAAGDRRGRDAGGVRRGVRRTGPVRGRDGPGGGGVQHRGRGRRAGPRPPGAPGAARLLQPGDRDRRADRDGADGGPVPGRLAPGGGRRRRRGGRGVDRTGRPGRHGARGAGGR